MVDDQSDSLTDKEKVFIECYLSNGFNATQAAKSAGYTGSYDTLRSIGSQNLTKPAIKETVTNRIREKAMEADEVLAHLADIARSDIGEIFIGSRISVKRAKEIGKTHLIKAYSTGKRGTSVEMYSRLEALEKIGRALGIYKDVSEQSVSVKLEGVDELIDRIYGNPSQEEADIPGENSGDTGRSSG